MLTNRKPSLATTRSTATTRAAAAVFFAFSLVLIACANGDAGLTADPAATADRADSHDTQIAPEPEATSEPEESSPLQDEGDGWSAESAADEWAAFCASDSADAPGAAVELIEALAPTDTSAEAADLHTLLATFLDTSTALDDAIDDAIAAQTYVDCSAVRCPVAGGVDGVFLVDVKEGEFHRLPVDEQVGAYAEARVALADQSVALGLDGDCPLLTSSE
jgi:hypothetical protein